MRALPPVLGLVALAAGCASPPPPVPPPPEPPAAVPAPAPPPPPPPVPPPAPPSAVPTSAPPAASASAKPRSDHLVPEDVGRIIKQNFARFRLCYEDYISRSCCYNLQNRVRLTFVIGRDGGVSNVRLERNGTDLPDSRAVSCMIRAMYGLSFPQPKGHPVTWTYPFFFTLESH